jgi:segregation and condensation protein B
VSDEPSVGVDEPEVPDEVGRALAESVAGESVTDPDPAEPDELGAPSLSAALEAILMLSDEPMPVVELAQAVRRPVAEVESCVRGLSREYDEQGRGFELREVAGGWRYYTRDECAGVVERWVLDGQQARLTQAALETLAVVAYRQPVSRARVGAVRGVNVDGVMRTLVSRGLVEEAGHDPESGAILYRTTSYFLERLGLASLDELPPLAEHLPDLADLDEVLDSVATGE